MRCPFHKAKLEKRGISWVCPRCDYKKREPSKHWIPELRLTVKFPDDYTWSQFTTTGITVTSGVASLSTGETTGTLVSPQFTNLTRSTLQKRDFTKAKIKSITAGNNDGRIRFYISNDGGTQYSYLYDNNRTKDLHYGKEGVTGPMQTKYDDLRLKIELKRASSSDTSPTITNLVLIYNQVPDTPWRVR